jgi:hypothetical protein
MATIRWLVPPVLVSDTATASTFGSQFAERPIQDNMRSALELGSPGEKGLFTDKGNNSSDREMFEFIVERNRLPQADIARMQAYRNRSSGNWARPDGLIHWGSVREYYEIKPMSGSSMAGGQRKFPKIDDFIAEFHLPYVRGERYMANDAYRRRRPILTDNATFQAELRTLQAMLGLRDLRLYVTWEKPEAGLIVYALEVTAETRGEQEPRNYPKEELARTVFALAMQATGNGTGASAVFALEAALKKIGELIEKLERDLEFQRNFHADLLKQATPSTAQKVTAVAGLMNPLTATATIVNIFVNPDMRPLVGAAVQMLNPVKHTLEIWTPVEASLKAAKAAWATCNVAQAFAHCAIGLAQYTRATGQLTAWREGTELAGKRAQLVIGVTAAVAILTAVAVYAAQALAVAGPATAAGAQTQAGARIVAALGEAMVSIATSPAEPVVAQSVEVILEEAPRQVLQLVLPTLP